MSVVILLDSLVLGSVAGTLALLVSEGIDRLRAVRSPHIRQQVTTTAALLGAGVLALALLFRPMPVGCMTRSCSSDVRDVGARGESALRFGFVASGKAAVAPAAASAQPIPRPVPWHLPVVMTWFTGMFVAVVRAARQHRSVARLRREAHRVTDPGLLDAVRLAATQLGLTRSIDVRRHPRVPAPAVAGLRHAVLFVPPDMDRWDASQIEMVLRHELTHLRRRDAWIALLLQCATALFWFQPLLWRAGRRIRVHQEVVADGAVLTSGVVPSRYAQFLLDAFAALPAVGRPQLVTSLVGDCLMQRRLATLLDPTAIRAAPRRWVSVALGVGGVVLTGLAAFAPGELLAAASSTFAQDAAQRGPRRELLNPGSLDSLLRPLIIDKMADRYIAGSAIVVVSGDSIVYREGFGRREVFHELPVDVDKTIWRIGSITKVLTGIAVMQLVDRGLVRLDADVNTYLDQVRVPSTFPEPVRVRNLLTHTSGFDQPGLGRHAGSPERKISLEAFLKDNLIRAWPPDVVTTYDTYAITLAGHLVERVSGLSYEQYLTRHLFQPLEMHRANINVPPSLQDDVAIGYGFAGHFEAAPWEYMNTDPASTVNATATGMGNLLVMLLNGGRFRGRQVLSEQSVRAMLTRQFTNDPEQPGFGYTFWEDRSLGVPAFSHGGSMTGYGAFLYLIPQHRIGVFIAFNQESTSLPTAAVSRLVAELFPGAGKPALRPRYTGPDDAARFAGTYASSIHNHRDPTRGWRRIPMQVTFNDSGQLVFQRQTATRVGPATFQMADGVLVTFRQDARRRITHMFVSQAVFERIE